MKTIYCDGSGNTDVCMTCIYIEDELIQLEIFFNLTNNEAEFLAVLRALEITVNERPVKIITDSKLVVESLKGNWTLRKDHLIKLQDECLLKSIGVTFEWIGRDDNKAGVILDRYTKSTNIKKFARFLDATANKEFQDPKIMIKFVPS